jgi:hypothetical protein
MIDISDHPLVIETDLFIENALWWGIETNTNFLDRLGCPTKNNSNQGQWKASCPPNEITIAARRWCLLKLLALDTDWYFRVSLLTGAMRHNCVELNALKDKDARALADTILNFIGYFDNDEIDQQAAPFICVLLNEWLLPSSPWLVLPGPAAVCRAMFGEAWCNFLLPEIDFDTPGISSDLFQYDIAAIVKKERPPFLPGLCPGQKEPPLVTLPENLGFPI